MIELHYSNGDPVQINEAGINRIENPRDGETTRIVLMDGSEVYVLEDMFAVMQMIIDERMVEQ